jgi:hypothetical protein
MSADKLAEPLPYEYQSLNSSKKQIRLIRLSPQHDDGIIHCDLETYDFEDAPEYVALSYTWGPSKPLFNVYVENQSIQVRENLFQFLQQYQKQGEQARYMWIDQICIDQLNVTERSSEVQFMSDIYRRAKYVVTWLSTLHSAPMCYDAARRFSEHRAIKDLAIMTQHEYFTRLWIVQEVVLARAVKVLSHDVWFSWDDMVGAVDNMIGKHDDEYREIKEELPFSLLLAPRNYRDHPWTWKSWGFDIVLTHSHLQCVDPRDKVYALLGLIDMDRRSIA